MKHVFIVNPAAGPYNAEDKVRSCLAGAGQDWEIYRTAGRGDATRYIRRRCTESNEPIRFYACGGDGTIKETAEGVVGFPHAEMSCIPCGSGNDFVKYYGGKDAFFDIPALMNRRAEKIDVIRVNDSYALNACHFGLDTAVAKTMTRLRRIPLFGGRMAYFTGVAKAFFFSMKSHATIIVDGEKVIEDAFLLCTVANGHYVGGSFHCAPRSYANDGLLDVCIVRPVSRYRFIRLVPFYTRGEHLDDPRFEGIIEYRRAKRVEVFSPKKNFAVSLDGEILDTQHLTAEVLPGAISFAAPRPSIMEMPRAAELPGAVQA